MATVLFKRGDNTEMDDTPIKDGLLFFNTEDNKIYMDNGNQRKQFGGGTDLIDNPTEATEQNAFSASGSLDLFLQKTTVVDTKANALAVTQNYIPLGCLAFKEMLGTTDYSGVANTVSEGLVKLRGETLQGTLAVGATSMILNSSILTSESYVSVFTDDYEIAPKNVTVDNSTQQITLEFDAQTKSVVVRVMVQNL